MGWWLQAEELEGSKKKVESDLDSERGAQTKLLGELKQARISPTVVCRSRMSCWCWYKVEGYITDIIQSIICRVHRQDHSMHVVLTYLSAIYDQDTCMYRQLILSLPYHAQSSVPEWSPHWEPLHIKSVLKLKQTRKYCAEENANRGRSSTHKSKGLVTLPLDSGADTVRWCCMVSKLGERLSM